MNDRQRVGLALAKRRGAITTQQYRIATGADGQTAASDLAGLAAAGLLEKRGERRRVRWALVERRPEPARTHRDRTGEILTLLAGGPASTAQLAEALGVTPEAVRYWLRPMEAEGKVRPTEPSRRSRFNRWELVPTELDDTDMCGGNDCRMALDEDYGLALPEWGHGIS